MKSAKGSSTPHSDCAYAKPAKTFEMPPKPSGSGSNPGGKHLAGKRDMACGQKGKPCQ